MTPQRAIQPGDSNHNALVSAAHSAGHAAKEAAKVLLETNIGVDLFLAFANFGIPSLGRMRECRENDLCHLCGEPLASDDEVHIFITVDASECGPKDPVTGWPARPETVGPHNIMDAGPHHPACARMSLAHCPVLRERAANGGSRLHGLQLQAFLVRTDITTWLEAEPGENGVRIINDFSHIDMTAIAPPRTESAPRKKVTTPGWKAFPKGLPRPLFDGRPVPYNMDLCDPDQTEAEAHGWDTFPKGLPTPRMGEVTREAAVTE